MPIACAYLSLGSNLGNREQTSQRCDSSDLESIGTCAPSSSLYETEPVEFIDQRMVSQLRGGARNLRRSSTS